MALGLQTGCTGGGDSESTAIQTTPRIQGFDETTKETDLSKGWVSVSDRKIRVGLVGYGVCKFSALFGFQNHPNVEVIYEPICAEVNFTLTLMFIGIV